MIKLRVVQARYGDCLILECGSGKRRKYVLIDGGPSGVYRPYLRPELVQIAEQGGKLALVVLTHVDSDHVVGLLELLHDIKTLRADSKPGPVEIMGMWHNAFDQVMPEIAADAASAEQDVELTLPEHEDLPVSFGVGEGEELQLGDEVLGIPRNLGFPGAERLVNIDTAKRPVTGLGVKLWVLGPTPANLGTLKQKWLEWLASQREGAVSFGAQAVVKPDDSINNLSSIMLLAVSGKQRILLTGDGLGSDVVSGLEQAGLLKPGQTFHVNILKLPHHGSARNVIGRHGKPEEFFDRVLADIYIISADGHYDNPDWDTLCWLTDASRRQQRKIEIFATNRTKHLDRLLRERPEAQYFYHLTIMPAGTRSVVF